MMFMLQDQVLSAPHNIEWAASLRILLGRKWPMMTNLWSLLSVLSDFLNILFKSMQGFKRN
uniref:Uncharacterized protein n=1 Tax=Arundo donax TaxID=35708 RepID=A0A0A9EPU7_ARUDO